MTRSVPPRVRPGKTPEDHRRLYSTTELAEAAGVTPRTVRFYEAQGLLQPQRAGIMRVYTYRDRARLALIRRSKRLGFSLQDIADVVALYNVDHERTDHARKALHKARGRIAELEEKMTDLQQTLRELRKLEQQASAQLEHVKPKWKPVRLSNMRPDKNQEFVSDSLNRKQIPGTQQDDTGPKGRDKGRHR